MRSSILSEHSRDKRVDPLERKRSAMGQEPGEQSLETTPRSRGDYC